MWKQPSFWLALSLLCAPFAARAEASDPAVCFGREMSDPELAGLRGGVRVGRFDLAISYRVRDVVDGREVFAAELLSTDLAGEAPRTLQIVPAGHTEVRFVHGIAPGGIVLAIQNGANGLDLRSEAQLDIQVRNFSHVFGSQAQRAARSLAHDLAGAEVAP